MLGNSYFNIVLCMIAARCCLVYARVAFRFHMNLEKKHSKESDVIMQ
jgi:hypothetical protein